MNWWRQMQGAVIREINRSAYQRGYADAARRCGRGWVYDYEKRDWIGRS